MFYRRIIFVVLILLCFALSPAAFASDGVTILCYHDISNKVLNEFMVSKDNLKAHFEYLKNNGYHPISLQQYIDANENRITLPDKPVLLTFDDGYISFYTEVYPLLKQYNYPAVLAVVTSWQNILKPADIGQLVTWQQMKEMESSGLVTIASHTHDLHHGVVANSYNDGSQATSTLIFRNGEYETVAQYKDRVDKDLAEAQRVLERDLGHKVEALVWPYGEYTEYAVEIAKSKGFKVMLGLGGGFNPVGSEKSLLEGRRGLMYDNPNVNEFAAFLKEGGNDDPPMKAVWVNIDKIYDQANPKAVDVAIHALIEHCEDKHITTVFLQAYSDPKNDGHPDSVYFYTKAAPVKALVFDHIARKLRDENIYVYALMPTLNAQWLTKEAQNDVVNKDGTVEEKATPFSNTVRNNLKELYTDLVDYSFIDGVVFQDDVYLSEAEDFSANAKTVFNNKFGRPLTPGVLHDQQIASDWTVLKTETMNDLTVELANSVRQFKPYAKIVRAVYPEVLLDQQGQEHYSQNIQQFLELYDYTLVVPGNYAKDQGIPLIKQMADVAAAAMKLPGAQGKIILEMPTYDAQKKQWLLDDELRHYVSASRDKGITNFGFYPDILKK